MACADERRTRRFLAKSGAMFDRISDVFATNGFTKPLSHNGVAVGNIKINQSRSAPNHRPHHTGERAGQTLFHGGKLHSTNKIRFRLGIRRRWSWRSSPFEIGVTAEKRAPIVFSQVFCPNHPREQTTVGKVLLNRSQSFLTGEKH